MLVLQMSATESYTLRIPTMLRLHIKQESEKRGISPAAWMVEACWSALEEPKDCGIAQLAEQAAHNRPVGGSSPPLASNLKAQLQASIDQIKQRGTPALEASASVAPLCGFEQRNHDTGQWGRCCKAEGHKLPHGEWQVFEKWD